MAIYVEVNGNQYESLIKAGTLINWNGIVKRGRRSLGQ